MLNNHVAEYKVDRFHECEECQGMKRILELDGDGNYGYVVCQECMGKGYYERFV